MNRTTSERKTIELSVFVSYKQIFQVYHCSGGSFFRSFSLVYLFSFLYSQILSRIDVSSFVIFSASFSFLSNDALYTRRTVAMFDDVDLSLIVSFVSVLYVFSLSL